MKQTKIRKGGGGDKKIAVALNTVLNFFCTIKAQSKNGNMSEMLVTARTVLFYLKFSAMRGLQTIPLNSKRLSLAKKTEFLIKISEL